MDFSFSAFLEGVSSSPILCITVLFTLGVIFVNGWTDAPNAIATCITTRCIRVRSAILMSAVFNFLGVLIMTQINSSVASTISNMVDFGGDTHSALVALCAALLSIVVYSVGASRLGIPTSESHSLIAGLTGAALAIQNGTDGINMDEWSKVLYGLVLSLVLGFAIIAFSNGQSSVTGMTIPVWLMLLCSIIMALGTSVGGEKIIKSVGMDMVKLEKYQGFSADLAAEYCLLLSSLFGIPVSTTHTKTSAIMGVGAVKRLSAINLGVVKDMVLTWIFTFPGCGLISFVVAKIFIAVF